METFLLAMLLEEHKEVMRLRNQLERLEARMDQLMPERNG
jgi:ubiquinone biosynthesis protein UbiJ